MPAETAPAGRLTIRPAQMDEADSMAEIHVRSFRATYPQILPSSILAKLDPKTWSRIWASRVQEAREAGRTVLVAEVEGQPAGFVYFGPAPDDDTPADRFAQVYSIHVDPGYSGRGIGSELVRHTIARMTSSGFQSATLWVVAGNRQARRFYERLGWSDDGSRRTEPLGLQEDPGEAHDVETVRYAFDLRKDSQE